MTELWHTLAAELDEGRSVFLAMVADNSDGSPGTAGAAMLVCPSGRQVGTIGGGRMELDLVQRAHAALAEGRFEPEARKLWHRRTAEGETSGLICSGFQTNVCLLCTPQRDRETVRALVACADGDGAGTVLLQPEGLGFRPGPVDLRKPCTSLAGDLQGAWRCEHQLLNRKRVAIVGGGHCGLALSRALRQLGYWVCIFDRRADVATFVENPWAHRRVKIDDYAEAGPLVEYPEVTRVIVMTTDYPSDVRALLGVVPRPFPFVGVMGSVAKINQIKADLRKAGVDSRRLDDLRAPVGLAIHSHTPEEIAVSIAGELIRDTFERAATEVAPASIATGPAPTANRAFHAWVAEKGDSGQRLNYKELTLDDLPADGVQVRVTHAGLNYKDALAVTGRGRILRSYPMVPGIDLAGIVEHDPAGGFAPGTPVFAAGQGLGELRSGAYAHVARVPAEWLRRVPAGRTCEAMALMGTAALTATLCRQALEARGALPGSGPVLVTGAGGGVGGFAVTLLAAAGYEVVAATGRAEVLADYLKALGASRVMPREELLRTGRPLEPERWGGVVDTVGGTILSGLLSRVKAGGVVAACGLAAGHMLETTLYPFLLRGVALVGIDSVGCPVRQREEAWFRVNREMPDAALDLLRGEVISLKQVPEYCEKLLEGSVRGRIVVQVDLPDAAPGAAS